MYIVLCSLITVLIGFSYLQYLALPIPGTLDAGAVAVIILALSMIAGYATKDALTAFGAASISALSLSLAAQVFIVKNMMGGVPTGTALIFAGQDALSAAFSSSFLAILGGFTALAITQTLLLRGPLLKRILAFGNPLVSAMDKHPWVVTFFMSLLSIMVTFIVTLNLLRR